MSRFIAPMLAVLVTFGPLGCAHRTPEDHSAQVEHAAVRPPSDSPLARIQEGMVVRQVTDLIGAPTDQKHYVTGKAFVPYYFGPDSHRVAYYYKGMGRVIFSGGNAFGEVGKVVRVEYDPGESGYAR